MVILSFMKYNKNNISVCAYVLYVRSKGSRIFRVIFLARKVIDCLSVEIVIRLCLGSLKIVRGL